MTAHFQVQTFEVPTLFQVLYSEPETQRNARPFGSSMAERQRFGTETEYGVWNRVFSRVPDTPVPGPRRG